MRTEGTLIRSLTLASLCAALASAPATGQTHDGRWAGTSSGDQVDCAPYEATVTVAGDRIAGRALLVTPQRKIPTEWEIYGRIAPGGRVWLVAATFDAAIPEQRNVSAFQGRIADGATIRLKQPPGTCGRDLVLSKR
jgi:hypothetical protein